MLAEPICPGGVGDEDAEGAHQPMIRTYELPPGENGELMHVVSPSPDSNLIQVKLPMSSVSAVGSLVSFR
jgi:hypothetical protein